jgi:V/A-type H+-transporting ATPase subunit K
MQWTIAIAVGLLLVFGARRLLRGRPGASKVRWISRGFLAVNSLIVLAAVALAFLWLFFPTSVSAAPAQQATSSSNLGLAAALATGLAAIGAGIGVGLVGAAAVGAVAEKPETFGRVLIFVGLAEGIAIYGLIISFIVLTGAFG